MIFASLCFSNIYIESSKSWIGERRDQNQICYSNAFNVRVQGDYIGKLTTIPSFFDSLQIY